MKDHLYLLLAIAVCFILCLFASCTTRDPVIVQHGPSTITVGKKMNLASKSYDRIMVDKNGRLTITTRDDATEVASEVVRTAGVAYGASLAAGLSEALSDNSTREVLGAQGVTNAANAGKTAVALEGIKAKAATDTLKITTPAQ